jgi:hypothetical protein
MESLPAGHLTGLNLAAVYLCLKAIKDFTLRYAAAAEWL